MEQWRASHLSRGRVGVEPLRRSSSRRIVIPDVGHDTTRRARAGPSTRRTSVKLRVSLAYKSYSLSTALICKLYLFSLPRFLTSIAPAPATATATTATTAPFTPPFFFFSSSSFRVFIPRNLA